MGHPLEHAFFFFTAVACIFVYKNFRRAFLELYLLFLDYPTYDDTCVIIQETGDKNGKPAVTDKKIEEGIAKVKEELKVVANADELEEDEAKKIVESFTKDSGTCE